MERLVELGPLQLCRRIQRRFISPTRLYHAEASRFGSVVGKAIMFRGFNVASGLGQEPDVEVFSDLLITTALLLGP